MAKVSTLNVYGSGEPKDTHTKKHIFVIGLDAIQGLALERDRWHLKRAAWLNNFGVCLLTDFLACVLFTYRKLSFYILGILDTFMR